MEKQYLLAKQSLEQDVKERFGKPLHSINSFEQLAEEVRLSSQTLRRFFGKIDADKKISYSSLSILCQYIGYEDWQRYLNDFENKGKITLKDQFSIQSMEPFFKSGQEYKVDYLQKTQTTDTLNEYAKVIYKSKENTQYFYELYHANNWATEYIFTWIPNYNRFGQNWYREILKDCLARTEKPATKLAISNFLFLGEYITKGNVDTSSKLAEVNECYEMYKLQSKYLPYHEMRYHTILLIEAKNKNDKESFRAVLDQYLLDLSSAKLSEFHYREMIIFLCNTLLWLQEYELAFQLLSPIKNFINGYQNSYKTQRPIHYFGVNMAFVKSTFSLAWITNHQNGENFDIEPVDFQVASSLLYNDYIKTMYLATAIISEKTALKKRIIFDDLQQVVSKTGYIKIYDILQDHDPIYHTYFS